MMFAERTALQLPSPPDPGSLVASKRPGSTVRETNLAKVLVITSGKGGVGKTTTTAALGAALAQAGQNVAVVDFDVGLRNLDLVMGAESGVGFERTKGVPGRAKRS